jgi:Mg-chelatase subunit ChlD
LRRRKRTSLKRAVAFSSEGEKKEKFSEAERIEELSGKMGRSDEKGLMHSVLENDRESIGAAKLLSQSLNYSIPLNADSILEELVSNYKLAKSLYGKTFIREITGFSEEYVENNRRIPEFRAELKKRIENRIRFLKKSGLIENDTPTEKGLELAAYINYIEEIDAAASRGLFGKKASMKAKEGERTESHLYKRDRYHDIDIAGTVKLAIRRSHQSIGSKDLKASERESRSAIRIVYALDSSGSMTGEKIEQCKKAGIALSHKAISDSDSVGLVVFGRDVKKSIPPTKDIHLLLREIMAIRPHGETDIASAIAEAARILSSQEKNSAKHLILITDAMPTMGETPEEDTKRAASAARSAGITISIVGIKLDKKAEEFAEKIVLMGKGRFYRAREIANLDRIVLEDYYRAIE